MTGFCNILTGAEKMENYEKILAERIYSISKELEENFGIRKSLLVGFYRAKKMDSFTADFLLSDYLKTGELKCLISMYSKISSIEEFSKIEKMVSDTLEQETEILKTLFCLKLE
ncbi:MAG: hypothetical protein V1886_02260 [archaeon]